MTLAFGVSHFEAHRQLAWYSRCF